MNNGFVMLVVMRTQDENALLSSCLESDYHSCVLPKITLPQTTLIPPHLLHYALLHHHRLSPFFYSYYFFYFLLYIFFFVRIFMKLPFFYLLCQYFILFFTLGELSHQKNNQHHIKQHTLLPTTFYTPKSHPTSLPHMLFSLGETMYIVLFLLLFI